MEFWRQPLDCQRVRIPRGEVMVFEERCKGCGFCVDYCPRDVLALAERFNAKGYHPPEVVREGSCLHCNLCTLICPEFAIFSYLVAPTAAGGAAAEGRA